MRHIPTAVLLLVILANNVWSGGRYTVSYDHTSKPPQGLPVWYLEPPNKPGFFIGLGAGESRVAALTVALSDLARKISRVCQDRALADSSLSGSSTERKTNQAFLETSKGTDYSCQNAEILFFNKVGIISRLKSYDMEVAGKMVPMYERFDNITFDDGLHSFAVKSFRLGTEDDYFSEIRQGANNASLQIVIDALQEFGLNIDVLVLYDADLFLTKLEMKRDDLDKVSYKMPEDVEVARKLKELFNAAQDKPLIDNPDLYRKFLEQK